MDVWVSEQSLARCEASEITGITLRDLAGAEDRPRTASAHDD